MTIFEPLSEHLRNRIEAVDDEVALGRIDTHGHVEPAIVKFLVQDF